jgi:hypothetical protein
MAEDLQALQGDFAKRAQMASERFQTTVDSEYWFCVSFDTRAQKHAFLRALGWDGQGGKFLDGIELARQMGIVLPPTPAALRFLREDHDPGLDALT